jgi:asparagine synthase (glutamine-hydrolysing)
MSLFYTACKDFFAFSTDIAALLSLVRPQFNPDALSYQAFEFTVGEETVFRNIFSVNPGEYIEISPDLQYEKKQYWTVWDNFVEAPSNAGDAIEQMEWLLEDAMRLRVRGVNATVLASGGIDSSLSAALLKPSVIHHVHYDFTDFNELEYARCLADHIGAELRLIAPTKEEYLRDKDAILRVVGMPTTWTSFTLWAAIIGMKADGFTVFFTGDGADELLAGYHRYHLLIHDEQIKELEAMQGYSYLIKRYYGSRVERYARLINRCEDERDERVRAYLETTLTRFSEHCRNDIVTFMTLTDFYTTSQALFFLTDRLCAHFSVNSFSPFMDYRMVQFAFSLDSKLKIHEGTTKWILKKIAARRLPAKIVERKDKRGFSAPINHWFGWDKPGQYNRTRYKQHVFADWLRVFAVEQK